MGFDSVIKVFAPVFFVIGAVECFAGFKLIKIMISIWGFLLGAFIGVNIGVSAGSVLLGSVLVLMVGVFMTVLAYKMYLAGIFFLNAGLTGFVLFIMCNNVVVAVVFGIGAGLLALFFLKPVVIFNTAIAGSGMIIISAYKMMDLTIGDSGVATVVLWVPIALTGIAVQYITNQRVRRIRTTASERVDNLSGSFSERKYPGMQRAYRNFCIKCGCELYGSATVCPRCGYDYDS